MQRMPRVAVDIILVFPSLSWCPVPQRYRTANQPSEHARSCNAEWYPLICISGRDVAAGTPRGSRVLRHTHALRAYRWLPHWLGWFLLNYRVLFI